MGTTAQAIAGGPGPPLALPPPLRGLGHQGGRGQRQELAFIRGRSSPTVDQWVKYEVIR